MKERDFILLVLCWNGANGLANGKPWISMPLSLKGFTMLTRVTFPTFRLSINIFLGPAEMVQLLRFWPDQFSQGEKNKSPFLQKASNKEKC